MAPREHVLFSPLTVASHLLMHSALMSNTPAYFNLCFVLSDRQGHHQGRFLQSGDELAESPLPGRSFHYHRDGDVRGGGRGPHSVPVQTRARVALDAEPRREDEAALDRFTARRQTLDGRKTCGRRITRAEYRSRLNLCFRGAALPLRIPPPSHEEGRFTSFQPASNSFTFTVDALSVCAVATRVNVHPRCI